MFTREQLDNGAYDQPKPMTKVEEVLTAMGLCPCPNCNGYMEEASHLQGVFFCTQCKRAVVTR